MATKRKTVEIEVDDLMAIRDFMEMHLIEGDYVAAGRALENDPSVPRKYLTGARNIGTEKGVAVLAKTARAHVGRHKAELGSRLLAEAKAMTA